MPCEALPFSISILNLIQSNFVHRSGLIYHVSVLPCHPCHFFPFLYLFHPLYFSTFNNKKLKLTSSLLSLLTKSTENNCAPCFLPPTIPQYCTEKAVIDPQLDTFSYVDNPVNVQTLSPMCHVGIFFNT